MNIRKKITGMMLTVLLVLSMIATTIIPVSASGTKQETKKIIGIVFDNSSSMIWGDDTTKNPISAWCQATYALEVFASMLNEGDELYVYPMNKISVGQGKDATTYTMDSPLEIIGGEDPTIIETIKTVDVEHAGTPMASINAAGDGLEKLGDIGDEKWLIVLTDGSSFCDKKGNWTDAGNGLEEWLAETMNPYAEDMNVMYLGIGSAASIELDDSGTNVTYADKAGSSEEITKKLTKMSNLIFGRDELSMTDNSFTTNVTMSKIIVFSQGDTNSDLVEELNPTSSIPIKYSTSHDGYDTSLVGVINTYNNVAIGSYNVKGGNSIAVYYEPDVDLTYQILDKDGNDCTQELTSGTVLEDGNYTFVFGLIDNGTGQMADTSQLGEMSYDITYSVNGEPQTLKNQKGETLAVEQYLEFGDEFSVDTVTAHYLSGYTLTKSGGDLSLDDLVMKDDVSDMTLDVGEDTIQIYVSEVNGYTLSFTSTTNGVQMTQEQLKRQTVDANLEGGNVYVEWTPTDVGFDVTLKFDGATKDIITGPYVLTLQTKYENSDGSIQTSNQGVVNIEVLPEPHTVSLDMNVPMVENYYQMSDLDDAKPITLTITKDGVPLTQAEMEKVQIVSSESDIPADGTEEIYLVIDTGDLPCDITKDPENSAVNLKPVKTDDGPAAGDYTVSAKAVYFDSNGITTEAAADKKVSIGTLPWWLKWLLIGLAILALLILLWLFMNMKVLPKKIDIESSDYRIEGEKTSGSARCDYSKQGKKGTIHITSPNNPNYPLCKCSLDVRIEADSPRRVPSRKRKVKVTGTPNAGTNIGLNKVKVGTSVFHVEYDDDDRAIGLFMKGQRPNSPEPENYGILQSGSMMSVEKDAPDDAGGDVDVVFKTKLIFK